MPAKITIQRKPEWRYTYQVHLRVYGYNPTATDINDLYPLSFRRVVGTFNDRESAQIWLRDAFTKAQRKRMYGHGVKIKKLMDRGRNEFRILTAGGNEWAWDIRAKKEERI